MSWRGILSYFIRYREGGGLPGMERFVKVDEWGVRRVAFNCSEGKVLGYHEITKGVREMEITKCSSCGAPAAERGATEFGCPECGEPLCRCARCRLQSVPYICRKCGFRGP